MPQDPTPDWAAFFEFDCQYAETVLLETSALSVMCIAHAMVAEPMTGTRLPSRADAIALSCMGEAWIGGAAAPDRVEAVCVALTYRLASGERQTMASLRAIERDASGKVVRLGDERAPSGQPDCWCIRMGGVFLELLPDAVTEEQRASATHTLARLAKAGAVKVSQAGVGDNDNAPAEETP